MDPVARAGAVQAAVESVWPIWGRVMARRQVSVPAPEGRPGSPGRSILSDPLGASPWSATAPSIERPTILYRSARPSAPDPRPEQVTGAAAVLAGSIGRSLPQAVRRTMEGVFGADLGLVRVHSGPTVARAVEAVGARAMTMGSDVYLPGGIADAPSRAELPLVAHELAHAVGHRTGTGAPGGAATPWVRLSRKESPEEQQASSLESYFMGSGGGSDGHPGTEPVNLTLARTPPAVAGGPALGSAPSASSWSGFGPSVQRTADDDPSIQAARAGIYAGGLGGSAASADGAFARIQRAEPVPAPAPTTDAPSADSGAKDNELAERVFKLLQRRLMIERERIGAVGRFGRFS